MKRFCFVAALVVITASTPALAADVGVSISVGEPGFYGQIDIGNVPRPVLVHPRPLIIQPVPVGVVAEPIYLHVPPGHAKNWRKHCARYNACGRPVYFVQGGWYNNVYVPQYRREHGDRFDHGDRDHRGNRNGHRGDRDDQRGRGRRGD
ncbi:MAG: hypothetical protein HY848_14070 [Betaproteobacteria bacterium]|nr:hypothetical protein [Betaproteobacteria bacterium]